MKKTLTLIALLLTFFAIGAVAQPASAPAYQSTSPSDDLEAFRGDLLNYVASLSALPPELLSRFGADSGSIARSTDSIRAMSTEDLRMLKAQMDRVPYWQQMPSVLAAAVQQAGGGGAVPSPRELGMAFGAAAQFNRVESIRQPLLSMVRTLRQIPAERVHPDYKQKVDALEQMIVGASEVDLLGAADAIQAHSAEWNLRLSRAMSSDPAVREMAVRKQSLSDDCGSSFPGAIVCAIGEIFDDVVDFFNAIPGYATSAFNSITNFFEDFGKNLPTSISGLANKIGLTNINWNDVANTALTYVRLPCPPAGYILPGFGTVGTIRTWKNWSGTVGFAGNAIKDLTPSDILTSVNLQAITIILNFPVQWVSRCLENSWQNALQDDELEHQELVETNLDVVASTRATQLSVNNTQAQTLDTTGDVAKIETKLDGLNALLGTIESTTLKTITTSERLEQTSIRVDTRETRIEDKVNNLQLQQGQTGDVLNGLRDLWLRMFIELDLGREANTRISLFQLPSSFGGYIELVKTIVADTLAKRKAAGVDVTQAMGDFNSAVASYNAGNFKSAYTSFRKAYSRSVQ